MQRCQQNLWHKANLPNCGRTKRRQCTLLRKSPAMLEHFDARCSANRSTVGGSLLLPLLIWLGKNVGKRRIATNPPKRTNAIVLKILEKITWCVFGRFQPQSCAQQPHNRRMVERVHSLFSYHAQDDKYFAVKRLFAIGIEALQQRTQNAAREAAVAPIIRTEYGRHHRL